MKKIITSVASLVLTSSISLLASSHIAHWGYTGHGSPDKWGTLSHEYTICSEGKNQSPINITSSLDAPLSAIDFHYTTSAKSIINNGHTVQVNLQKGSFIEIEGNKYELLQFHFHTPSENKIDGKSFPLEAHFVHSDKDGNLAVVGVMFEDGKDNQELAKIWKKMPMKTDGEHSLTLSSKDINALLPKNKDYYRFNGSLTTPPCSEGVKWFVLSTPTYISDEQTEKFAHVVHGFNNRPIQDKNARIIIK